MLVDEADLWPDGKFVTTNIIVRTEFLEQYPDVVEAFLKVTSRPWISSRRTPTRPSKTSTTTFTALTGLTDRREDSRRGVVKRRVHR